MRGKANLELPFLAEHDAAWLWEGAHSSIVCADKDGQNDEGLHVRARVYNVVPYRLSLLT
jgi:hypothetical protein